MVRVAFEFTNSMGTSVDPAAVFFSFKTNQGVVTTYQYGIHSQAVKTDTGNYYVDIDADTIGTVYYRAFSTGSGKAANEDGFNVRSRF